MLYVDGSHPLQYTWRMRCRESGRAVGLEPTPPEPHSGALSSRATLAIFQSPPRLNRLAPDVSQLKHQSADVHLGLLPKH